MSKAKPRARVHKKFGLRVVEAKTDMPIKLLQIDIQNAQKVKTKSPHEKDNFLSCVIAQAATRALGAESVAIMHRTAYVAYPGEKVTRRYQVDATSQRVLEAWDKGEHVTDSIELVLKRPSPKRTRAAMRKTYHRLKDTHKIGTRRKQKKGTRAEGVVRDGNLVRL